MDNDHTYSTCLWCRKRERVFRKSYFNPDGSTIHHQLHFSVCQNSRCPYYIPIETGKRIYTDPLGEEAFEWVML